MTLKDIATAIYFVAKLLVELIDRRKNDRHS